MSGENDADDVVPESEDKQESGGFDNSLYEQEQNRKMSQQAELRAMCIENGDDAEKFKQSRFGQYLLGQAELDEDQAKEALTEVDADDVKTIRKLQNRIWRARSFSDWVDSAIEQGNAEYIEYIQAQQAGEG